MFLFYIHRRQCVKELLASVEQTAADRSMPGRKSAATGNCRRLKSRHFPSHIKPAEGQKRKNPTRRCVVCMPAERELRAEAGLPSVSRPGRESAYECHKCDKGVCVDPCFRLYHTHKEFVLAYKRLKKKDNTDSATDSPSGSSSDSDLEV